MIKGMSRRVIMVPSPDPELFENAIFIKNINTKKTKIGNTEMLIDVTEIGTVISVVQNIP